MPLFERPDFEMLIDPKAKPTEAVVAAAESTAPARATRSPTTHPLVESEGGFYVSRGSVVVLAVMMVVLVALAFATGFLLGS